LRWETLLFCTGRVGSKIVLSQGTLSGENHNAPDDENGDWTVYDIPADRWWFRFSPDDTGGMPFMGVSQSRLGSIITNYHTDISGFVTKHIGGPEDMHASVYSRYTGVIG